MMLYSTDLQTTLSPLPGFFAHKHACNSHGAVDRNIHMQFWPIWLVFFFEIRQKICHFHWLRRRNRGFGPRPNYKALLSRHYITQKFCACQAPHGSLLFDFSNNHPTGITGLWKTRAFLSFQISHKISIIKEMSALWDCEMLQALS